MADLSSAPFQLDGGRVAEDVQPGHSSISARADTADDMVSFLFCVHFLYSFSLQSWIVAIKYLLFTGCWA
jgi:hypothetical protein